MGKLKIYLYLLKCHKAKTDKRGGRMSTNNHEGDSDNEIDANHVGEDLPKTRRHDAGVADLEKVTDYVEEQEIAASAIGDALNLVGETAMREQQTKAERAQELARVKISKEDVDLIMNEMMVSRTVAETKLREHRGNVVDALMELVQ